MNVKVKMLTRNLSYSFMANIVSFIISILMILIVPKKLGVIPYGYWQLYLFYSSYVGLFSFGWVDGIYLRYGGKDFSELNRNKFSAQFWVFTIVETILSFLFIIFAVLNVSDIDKQFIFIVTGLACFTTAPRGMLLYIFQATNKIKEYSIVTVIEKVVSILLICYVLFIDVHEYKILLAIDIFAKFLSLLLAIYYGRKLIFYKFDSLKNVITEAEINIRVGIKLMLANIAGMLILGIVKFAIEQNWDIATFGKISLSMSVSNMLMTFINAVGIVLFPMLKKVSENKMGEIYHMMQNILLLMLLTLLFSYYPAKIILSVWLPQYNESLRYMALLFPICIFESKMAMLLNTYLKALRKEKQMLIINMLSVVLSLIITLLGILIFDNLIITVLTIVVCFGFRCVVSEYLLSKYIAINVKIDILLEVIISICFIVFSWNLNIVLSSSLYIILLLITFYIKRSDIKIIKSSLFGMMRK